MKFLISMIALTILTTSLQAQKDELNFTDFRLFIPTKQVLLNGPRDLSVKFVVDKKGQDEIVMKFNTETPEGKLVNEVQFILDDENYLRPAFTSTEINEEFKTTDLYDPTPTNTFSEVYEPTRRSLFNNKNRIVHSDNTSIRMNPDGSHTIFRHDKKTAMTMNPDGTQTTMFHNGNRSTVINQSGVSNSYYLGNPHTLAGTTSGRYQTIQHNGNRVTEIFPNGSMRQVSSNNTSTVVGDKILLNQKINRRSYYPPNIITREITRTSHELHIPLTKEMKTAIKESKSMIFRVKLKGQTLDIYLKKGQLKSVKKAL